MENFIYFFIRLRNGRCRRELGEKLQELRREQRKTIGVVSHKTGIAPCVIDCIELGLNAHMKSLERLCAYYGKRIELCLRDMTPEETAQILAETTPATEAVTEPEPKKGTPSQQSAETRQQAEIQSQAIPIPERKPSTQQLSLGNVC